MTDQKRKLTNKVAAGAILVALSGFVPNVTRQAQAATATISATGSFTGGITMTAGNDLQFGKMVATAAAGKMTITTGGATATSNGFFNGGTQTNGTIKFAAGALKAVDITVAGIKNSLTLAPTGGGKTAGTVNLPEVYIGGPFAASEVFKIATTKNSATLTSTTADLQIGGRVTWAGGAPLGAFSQALVVTVNY